MIRIAAVGDVHVGDQPDPALEEAFGEVGDRADVLLLAGDLTRCGTRREAEQLARALRGVAVPVVAVLGNHDHHSDEPDAVRAMLEKAGVHVLEGDALELELDGTTLGVAGTKGFGGGFAGACASEFGEPEMRSFAAHGREVAATLQAALESTDTDITVALTHYSPVADTLRGEHPEIYPFLGSYLLAEAIDSVGADLALHGHAHAGIERGLTPGGVRVRNVAKPVIRRFYALFELEPARHRDTSSEAHRAS